MPDTAHYITHGGYARISRVKTGDLICVYSRGRGVCYRWSRDNAKTWGDERVLARSATHHLTNAEIATLENGDLLYVYNARPKEDSRDSQKVSRYEICLKRSIDGGANWGPEQVLYQAGATLEEGCWEPTVIQLPDGECQLFFANEGPYTISNEQEISMLRSHDNGQTWSGPTTVSFAPGRRDGMPVATLLGDGRSIAVAIEDNSYTGRLKPTILSTPTQRSWSDAPLHPGGDHRWRALAHRHQVPAWAVYAAPYLVSLPNGGTLLSGQSNVWMKRPTNDVSNVRMAVSGGDSHARDFGPITWPFASGDFDRQQTWNSLFVKDAETVIAVSGIKDGPNGTGIYTIEGRLSYGAE